MRRAIVLECAALAAVVAVALAGSGRRESPVVAAQPPLGMPAAVIWSHPPITDPPCIRDSPGGRCTPVCVELVGSGSTCRRGKARLVPVLRGR
jgi:hypothetical protein